MRILSNSRLMMAAAVWLLVSGAAIARPAAVEIFDAKTWPQLSGSVKEPSIVVFSTTDCVHCPALIRKLAKEKSRYGKNVKLFAVVMDGNSGVKGKAPYDLADRLFIFEGNDQAIRFSVNPDWRGVTPYTALLSPGKSPRYVIGTPAEKDLQAMSVR